MKTTIFLRIAAGLTFVHAVLHTIGGVFGRVAPGPAAVAELAMKTNQFPLMGHTRSFWHFYRGLGLAVTVSLTAEAIAFWQLALLARVDAQRLRPILLTFFVAYLALAVNSSVYFFLPPEIVEIFIAACLGLAIVSAKTVTARPGTAH
ncbi:MAG: hypothetical protein JOZ14_00045 [Acidobacteria bacterium]|nr:hypothetical protein [Acidobacteriota bacterium]